MKVCILGLDIGKNTGWAVMSASDSGIELKDYGIIRSKDHVDFYKKIRQRIEDELSITDKDVFYIAYEEVLFNKSIAAARAYGGYIAALKIACDSAGVKNQLIPLAVSEVKKYVGGSHVANKDEVAKGLEFFDLRIKARLPDDITDAIAVALTACGPVFMPGKIKERFHEKGTDDEEI